MNVKQGSGGSECMQQSSYLTICDAALNNTMSDLPQYRPLGDFSVGGEGVYLSL